MGDSKIIVGSGIGRFLKRFHLAFSAFSRLPRNFFFCNRNYGQRTLSEQVLKIFGDGQNHQNGYISYIIHDKKKLLL